MNKINACRPKAKPGGFDYFVLFFCLFVPTFGTLAFFVLLDHLHYERLAFGCMASIYLSGVILGLLNVRKFKAHCGSAQFRALALRIAFSGLSALVAVGALILSWVAAGLNIH